MEEFVNISIRGRMAYMLCLFERLLIHYELKSEEWNWILEKLWSYTEVQYLDDWIYETAEFLPENILEDEPDMFEYINESEYKKLLSLYSKNYDEINQMIKIIYDLGTVDAYSQLLDNSPNTLLKLKEATAILIDMEIELVDSELFKNYQYSECNGWGKPFDGKILSLFLQ